MTRIIKHLISIPKEKIIYSVQHLGGRAKPQQANIIANGRQHPLNDGKRTQVSNSTFRC